MSDPDGGGADEAMSARVVVRRCRLTPGLPQVYPAWFQRLNRKHDALLSSVAFSSKLRHYIAACLLCILDGAGADYPSLDRVVVIGTSNRPEAGGPLHQSPAFSAF